MRNLAMIVLIFVLISNDSVAQYKKRGSALTTDFLGLPYLKKGIQTYQFSSTDPAEDQFNDYSHWLYTNPDSSAVLADIKGPGTIHRIWSTGNSGDSNRIKIYIDGVTTAAINETFNQFHNRPPLRDKPQVGAGGDKYLAWWSYMPISFRKSIKIVREGNFRPFYNITYHTYSDTTGVRSWSKSESNAAQEAIWSDPTSDPKPTKGNKKINKHITIAAGNGCTVFNQSGAGYIAALKINNYLPEKDFLIRIYWDDEKKPSVEAPVKWFFGSIDNGGDLKALGVGTQNNNGYCYFPMPFWKKARIELVNNSKVSTGEMNIEVAYNNQAYPKNSTGYFHSFANDVEKPGSFYTCLQTRGRGHVIGMAKRMPKGGHACEADEIYYIDDRKFPDIYGTGEEDYANCAWWKNSYNSYPTHGAIGNDCYYRMHFPDMIVYEQSLDMKFESWQNYYIASVVWYYESSQPSLIATDSLDIMNIEDEKTHSYSIEGEKWSGTKSGAYPGKRVHSYTATDDGRSFSIQNSFTMKTAASNKGLRLRVRTEQIQQQSVKVFVDGIEVKERPWVITRNNFNAIWIDADFEIPERYTRGKDKVNITLKAIGREWVAYGYTLFSYVQ